MKKYLLFCLSLLLYANIPASAQDDDEDLQDAPKRERVIKQKQYPTRIVKGRVLNEMSKTPLSGAMVRVAEIDGFSTLSHSDGTYELKVPLFATSLMMSAPGYNAVKIGLSKGEQQQDAMLYSDIFAQEYNTGTNVTSNETASDFRFSNAVSIEDEIQKQLGANVHVTARGGMPGIGSVMFINGLNSLNVNAQPLIVVDGVIFDQQYSRTTLHEGFYNNVLANINPTDIEKVTVLRNGTAL